MLRDQVRPKRVVNTNAAGTSTSAELRRAGPAHMRGDALNVVLAVPDLPGDALNVVLAALMARARAAIRASPRHQGSSGDFNNKDPSSK